MKKLLVGLLFVFFGLVKPEVDCEQLVAKINQAWLKVSDETEENVKKIAKGCAQITRNHLDAEGIEFVNSWLNTYLGLMPDYLDKGLSFDEVEKAFEELSFNVPVRYYPSSEMDSFLIFTGSLSGDSNRSYQEEESYVCQISTRMIAPVLNRLEIALVERIRDQKKLTISLIKKEEKEFILIDPVHFLMGLCFKILSDETTHQMIINSSAYDILGKQLDQEEKQLLVEDVKRFSKVVRLGWNPEYCRQMKVFKASFPAYQLEFEVARELEFIFKYEYSHEECIRHDLTKEERKRLDTILEERTFQERAALIGDQCPLVFEFENYKKEIAKRESEIAATNGCEVLEYYLKTLYKDFLETFTQEL